MTGFAFVHQRGEVHGERDAGGDAQSLANGGRGSKVTDMVQNYCA